MLFSIELTDRKGLNVSCSGKLTGEVLIGLKRSLATERNRGLRYLFVDLSGVDELHISAAELQLSIQEDKRLAAIAAPGMLVAVVAPKDLSYGLSRMWEAYADKETGWQTRVFRSTANAELWIQERCKHLEPAGNADERQFA